MYFVKTIQATTAQAIYSYRFDYGGAGSCKYGSFLATSPSKRMLKGALANLGIKVPLRLSNSSTLIAYHNFNT